MRGRNVQSILVAERCYDAKKLKGGASAKLDPEALLTVTVYNVGSGEAILMRQGNRGVLIDGGVADSNQAVIDSVAARTCSRFPPNVRIEAIIASHPHEDHTNFYPYLIRNQQRYLAPSVEYYDNDTRKPAPGILLDSADGQWQKLQQIFPGGLPFVRLPVNDQVSRKLNFADGGLLFRGKRDPKQEYWSVFLVLRHGDARFLFSGDAYRPYENDLLPRIQAYTNRIHVLKITHHGSAGGTSPSLVRALKPGIAVASSSDHRGHELTPTTLDTLTKNHVLVFATYQDPANARPDTWPRSTQQPADVTVRTDGQTRTLGGHQGILFEVER